VVSIRGEAVASAGGWRLSFHVIDTGPGIAAEAQARLFTPFEQGDASINRRFGGSGLGLSISLRLCEAMGGGITLASEPGRGSTFTAVLRAGTAASATRSLLSGTVTVAVAGLLGESVQLGLERCGLSVLRSGPGDLLVIDGDEPDVAGLVAGLSGEHPVIILSPLMRTPPAVGALDGRPYRLVAKPPDPEDLAAAVRELRSRNRTQRHDRQSTAAALPVLSLAGLRILYADDQHVNRLVVAGQLKRLGIEVELATGGAEAIDLALADTWDVILLDCQMPEVDGFSALARIRERGCRTPLVAVTAHAMAGDREECLLRGFDDYLAKPVRPSERHRHRPRASPDCARRSASRCCATSSRRCWTKGRGWPAKPSRPAMPAT
jgi:CheY-like chemotaxis protein